MLSKPKSNHPFDILITECSQVYERCLCFSNISVCFSLVNLSLVRLVDMAPGRT